MRWLRNPSPLPVEGGVANQRRHGRLRCNHLICRRGGRDFATVVDMSASGLRAYRKGGCGVQAGDFLGLTLTWFEVSLPAKVRVAWVRSVGFRKHLLGLEFVDESATSRAAISRLNQLARDAMAQARSTYDPT
jgi:hypothetical protein